MSCFFNGFWRKNKTVWDALQVCWCCRATKGSNGDLQHCYVNVHPNAAWRATIGMDPPWQHEPAYSRLIGFHPMMIALDLLHIWHLGVGRDSRLTWAIQDWLHHIVFVFVNYGVPLVSWNLVVHSCVGIVLRTYVARRLSASSRNISGLEVLKKNDWRWPADGCYNLLRRTNWHCNWENSPRQT